MKSIVIFFLVVFVLVVSASVSARTWYVPSVECPTIQAGIDSASAGDTVSVADGTYTGNGNRDLNYYGKTITVRSQSGNPDACIIDCEATPSDKHRGFYFGSGEGSGSVLEGVTITNGYAFGEYWPTNAGGAIYCGNSSPRLINCVFSSDSAQYGGGVACALSSPQLTNCTFTGNYGNHGGGMYGVGDCSPALDGCSFSDNSAGFDGGGMTCESSCSPVLTSCTFSGNYTVWADGWGGGIFTRDYSSPELTNCIFYDNSTDYGGGILMFDSSPKLTNCTLSGNSADSGGGIFCTGNSNPTITNCIAWGNASQEIFVYGGASPVVSYSDIEEGWPGEGNIDADPQFTDPGNDDYHLSVGSPCIDAGNNAAVPPDVFTDLDGNPRIVDGDGDGTAIVDMGAYEAPPFGGGKGACCIPGGGCVDDITADSCLALGGRFMGGGTTCDAVECPTLTQWGLIVLVVLIVLSAWVVLRRRRPVVSRQ